MRRKQRELDKILRTEREILRVETQILSELHLTKSIALHFSGESTMNTLTLAVGQSSTGTIVPLLADGTTPSGGAVSAATFSIPPDPSFSATDNADGTVTIVGLAAGSTVTGTASATVTDTDGAVSNLSASFTVTVTPGTTPPPAATTVSIGVSFSTPA